MSLKLKQNLPTEYVDQILKPYFEDLLKQSKKDFTYRNVAELSKKELSITTISRIFKDYYASTATKKYLWKTLKIFNVEEWKKKNTIQGIIRNKLENNYWLSYRFDSKRQLYVSSWIFTNKEGKCIVSKLAAKGAMFTGEFEIDDDLRISGTLTDGKIFLYYQTYLCSILKEQETIIQMPEQLEKG